MFRHSRILLLALCAFSVVVFIAPPAEGQSSNVVFIGGTALDTNDPCNYYGAAANVMGYTYGGCLPVTGGELGAFTFAAMDPSAVSATSLASYDTAVLNVASEAMACNTATLTSAQKTDIVSFVAAGNKLIIYDSECWSAVDYSWLPFPFTTANPGAMGAQGTLTIVEENPLSTSDVTDPYYIDAYHLGVSTDAVGDMNVMTTFDPNWCLDMSGTNYLGVTGPVHTYAKVGFDVGLIIYNGLDMDYLTIGDPWLRKVWVQELKVPFDPSNLPCGFTVVGIVLGPGTAQNYVGEDHSVTATLSDLLGQPSVGIVVNFAVVAGPNAGTTGTCTANSDCSTDVNGEVTFTYTGDGGTGIDEIEACFIHPESGDLLCSTLAYKEWEGLPVPVDIKPTSCRNPFNIDAKGVLPVAILGTAGFDVSQIDPATVRLAGVAPLRWSIEDVATPFEPYLGKSDPFDCTTLGPDGFADLTFKFRHEEVAAALGACADGDVLVVPLDGFLLDGVTYILGEDVIVILEK